MAKHLKGRLYKKLIRFLCNYPGIVKSFYGAFQFVVIRIPFLRSSYKWKMIRKRVLHFELNKALYKKGKPCEHNRLYELDYRGGKSADPDSAATRGSFTLDVVVNGLLIKGKASDERTNWVRVMIDGRQLRKITLGGGKEFFTKVQPGVIAKFPKESRMTIESDDGGKLLYGSYEDAIILTPFGLNDIASSLDEGILLSKKGGMQASREAIDAHQNKFLGLYAQVRDTFERELGIPLFLTYGTLLGHTRQGDFIPNDDDFDAGYVSLLRDPVAVKKETIEIMFKLIQAGYSIGINAVGRLFKISRGTGVHLDLMPVWFEGEWNVAYRGACVKAGVDDFLPPGRSKLRDVDVYVPRKPEVFLEGYYGKSWRIPDPGYVSDFRQTGKNLKNNYGRFLLTPYEYLALERRVLDEGARNPGIGAIKASSLSGSI